MNDPIIEQHGITSGLNITLRDVTIFINWMHQTTTAWERGQGLPEIPDLVSGEMKFLIQAIRTHEERFRRYQERQLMLEADLGAQEKQLGRVVSQLYLNMASLYENLGQVEKAQDVRKKAAVLESS